MLYNFLFDKDDQRFTHGVTELLVTHLILEYFVTRKMKFSPASFQQDLDVLLGSLLSSVSLLSNFNPFFFLSKLFPSSHPGTRPSDWSIIHSIPRGFCVSSQPEHRMNEECILMGSLM